MNKDVIISVTGNRIHRKMKTSEWSLLPRENTTGRAINTM